MAYMNYPQGKHIIIYVSRKGGSSRIMAVRPHIAQWWVWSGWALCLGICTPTALVPSAVLEAPWKAGSWKELIRRRGKGLLGNLYAFLSVLTSPVQIQSSNEKWSFPRVWSPKCLEDELVACLTTKLFQGSQDTCWPLEPYVTTDRGLADGSNDITKWFFPFLASDKSIFYQTVPRMWCDYPTFKASFWPPAKKKKLGTYAQKGCRDHGRTSSWFIKLAQT